MDYVDYCQRLVAQLVETESRITYGGHTSITVGFLLQQLHGQGDMVGWDDPGALDIQTFRDALEDMIQRGYLQGYFKLFQVSSTPEGRSFARNPVSHWAESCRRKLDHESDQVLRAINEQSEHRGGIFAFRRWIDYGQLIPALGWSSDIESTRKLDKVVRNLYVDGFVEFGGSPNLNTSRVRSSYEGLVWRSRRDQVVHWLELDSLVAEWETCNVDFKRELLSKSRDQKAEFIKDVLGLANTQSSGRRWMVIGFDDKTRQQYVPSVPTERQTYQSQLTSIKVEHLEQILSSYTDPPVPIRLKHLRYRRGPVVAIEILRDARHVPYRVSKELRGEKRHLQPGDIFVRHGSITQPPTAQELKALELEAERARQEVSAADVDDEFLSDDEAAESEAAWRSYLAGDDPGATIEEVRRELLGVEDT